MTKERNDKAAALAATLPEDRGALLDVTAEAVAAQRVAVLAYDDDAAEAAAARYEAAVLKLNGGDFFGCMDRCNPDAGGILADQHCRAEPCTVPMWGQSGEFLITVAGIRCMVEIGDGFGRFRVSMHFHVVDHDAPFISETGFRSHFDTVQGGRTVDEVATAVFAGYLAKERRPLAPEYRQRRANEAPRAWLATLAAPDAAALAYEDTAGQMAFGF